MGNQGSSQRSLASDRSSKFSSYLSRRGSRHATLTSTREQQRSTIGRSGANESAGSDGGDSDSEKHDKRIPADVDKAFEFVVPLEGKMHRNLCGCVHRHMRVDIMSVARSSGKRTLYVDRQLSLQASAVDIAATETDLKIMCYLATRSGSRGHPNLIELLGHFANVNAIHVLTKYYELGDLRTMLQTTVQLQKTSDKSMPHFRTPESLRTITRDIFQGVAFMHRHGVAHLDLALENIYVGLDGRFRVGDFRHARFVGSRGKFQCAPAPVRKVYAAPELYSGREVDLLKADAWSLGIITLMVLTMETPFAEATARDPRYQLLQLWGLSKLIEDMNIEQDATLAIPQDMLDLLSSLLSCDPKHRASVLHAVDLYPWLQAEEAGFAAREVVVHASTSHASTNMVAAALQ